MPLALVRRDPQIASARLEERLAAISAVLRSAADDMSMALVRRGYIAFNSGDAETLLALFAKDVIQHVPGSGPFAGTYKGPEAVLGYYGRLAQDTGGAIRGAVRADFFWGFGEEAAALAGRMRQSGRMWVLLPNGYPLPAAN